jgi:hypothetical protein
MSGKIVLGGVSHKASIVTPFLRTEEIDRQERSDTPIQRSDVFGVADATNGQSCRHKDAAICFAQL